MAGNLIQKALIIAIRLYQVLISSLLGQCCRFEPTCSAYAMEAIKKHGALKGSRFAIWRVLRCHPWQPGGVDPVPCNPLEKKSTDNV